MGKSPGLEDIPADARELAELQAGIIPTRYEVYAKVLLLLHEIPIAGAVWVINKAKRDLEMIVRESKPKEKKNE